MVVVVVVDCGYGGGDDCGTYPDDGDDGDGDCRGAFCHFLKMTMTRYWAWRRRRDVVDDDGEDNVAAAAAASLVTANNAAARWPRRRQPQLPRR